MAMFRRLPAPGLSWLVPRAAWLAGRVGRGPAEDTQHGTQQLASSSVPLGGLQMAPLMFAEGQSQITVSADYDTSFSVVQMRK